MATQLVIEVLERQHSYLQSLAGAAYLAQLPKYLEFLSREPQVAVHVRALESEALRCLVEFRRADEETSKALVGLRRKLAAAAPEVDDTRPDQPAVDWSPYHDLHFSFGRFDDLAGLPVSNPFLRNPESSDDPSRSGELFETLRVKLDLARYGRTEPLQGAALIRVDLEDMLHELKTLLERHESRFYNYLLDARTLAGFSWARLAIAADQLVADPPSFSDGEARKRWYADHFFDLAFTDAAYFRAALFGGRLRPDEVERLSLSIARLKGEGERLFVALRSQIGSQLSHRAVVNRFRGRCQAYRASELRRLVDQSPAPEDDLTRELALHLFDNGFNPITKPLVGGLEPDLLDPLATPWGMYVEAKQYGRQGKSGRTTIRLAAQQVWDTVGRLNGAGYPVSEAFLVVFRLGGPRYVLPDYVDSEGVTLWPLLVDIAPASESGSRQRSRPLRIDDAELLPGDDTAGAGTGA